MSRRWNIAQLKCRAIEMSRRWEIAQLKCRSTGRSRSWNVAQMDVAQMGYRARKKSRKWHFPFTHISPYSRCVEISTYARLFHGSLLYDIYCSMLNKPGQFSYCLITIIVVISHRQELLPSMHEVFFPYISCFGGWIGQDMRSLNVILALVEIIPAQDFSWR